MSREQSLLQPPLWQPSQPPLVAIAGGSEVTQVRVGDGLTLGRGGVGTRASARALLEAERGVGGLLLGFVIKKL